ncbi:MAG: DUF2161 family putative PD-(D/E)XK-type phosphodiesterase [Psychromonas sp.]
MTIKIKESDLYLPIKKHLQAIGYLVKGEIKNCDIVAQRTDPDGNKQLIIIELKLSLNITLLLQSIDRFSLANIVYIAIPKQCTIYKKQHKQVKKLIKRLGLGLIIVDMQKTDQFVEVISDPQDYSPRINKRKQAGLLAEFTNRQGDPQKGGSTKSKAGLTAYRQRCIRIAQYLSTQPLAKGKDIKNAINEQQATLFLNKNYYGWFEKVSHGTYKIADKGIEELSYWLDEMKRISNKKGDQ